jgi:rod shape-determining protein MreD
MRWFRFAVLILAVAVLQKGVLARLYIKPDLLLVLLVFFAIYCNTSEAIISSFAIGFAADLIGSPMPMGPQMISFGLFGTLLAYLHRVIAIRRMPYQALAIFATGLLTGALTHLLAFLIKSEPISANIYAAVFRTSICSSLVGPFLFLPSAWWMRIRINRFRRR